MDCGSGAEVLGIVMYGEGCGGFEGLDGVPRIGVFTGSGWKLRVLTADKSMESKGLGAG